MTAIITAYCACSICCHDQLNLTAAGNRPTAGRTIAAPRAVHLGSSVIIGGHTYTVEDRTAKKFDGRFDIFVRTHKEAVRFGKREMNVTILK
jgi:hypothetical protein